MDEPGCRVLLIFLLNRAYDFRSEARLILPVPEETGSIKAFVVLSPSHHPVIRVSALLR